MKNKPQDKREATGTTRDCHVATSGLRVALTYTCSSHARSPSCSPTLHAFSSFHHSKRKLKKMTCVHVRGVYYLYLSFLCDFRRFHNVTIARDSTE